MLFNKVWSITKEIFFGQALFLFKLPKAKLQFLVPILVLISSWGLTDSIQVLFTIKKYIYNFKTLSCVIFLKDTNYTRYTDEKEKNSDKKYFEKNVHQDDMHGNKGLK